METTNAFDLGAILASLIVYLGYLAGLATACQAAINKSKPILLEPLRNMLKLDDNGWLILMYVAQFVFAVIGFATLGWSNTLVTALAPVLVVLPIPPAGILVFSILLVVAGTEIIYGLIKGIEGFKDSVGELGKQTPVNVEAQSGSKVDVNVERAAPQVQPDFYKDKR
jgi:hypothetical protein